MPYRYYTTVTSASPNQTLISGFQALLNQQFSVASDYFVIQEESIFGSGSYVDIGVRINSAVQSPLGTKLGDDFKNILFKDLNTNVAIGKKYYFDSNYWITIFTEAIKNLAANCTVRRCNNTLRWMDTNGNYFEEPAILDYEIARPRDQMGAGNPVTPAGYLKIYCQENARTKTIKGNQRFLFGPVENRIAMKIFGDGVRGFLNQQTSDDTSPALLEFQVGGNYVNPEVDNVTLGIADAYLNYGTLVSGSDIGTLDIVVDPSTNYVVESGSRIYDVRYYSGSNIHSGSFTFSISGSQVPTDHYDFYAVTPNTFAVVNYEMYLDHSLDILASGSSGSRIVSIDLRGKW